ncbi:hypothetical protein HAL09_13010 [Helicobacter ailurogastricus]|uniref:Uncharacterized protein n=1 Tax=Helicobacter ailurogastricus TaxID=1578720 RepID=A0A0K2X8R8_9HELI|nr:hypothetical protein HAL011_08970 [Helicobacter ailurogastricus]CRF44696.1 hypothetical protein HAL09_13010 [Helicobacter ailurogastricus]
MNVANRALSASKAPRLGDLCPDVPQNGLRFGGAIMGHLEFSSGL